MKNRQAWNVKWNNIQQCADLIFHKEIKKKKKGGFVCAVSLAWNVWINFVKLISYGYETDNSNFSLKFVVSLLWVFCLYSNFVFLIDAAASLVEVVYLESLAK